MDKLSSLEGMTAPQLAGTAPHSLPYAQFASALMLAGTDLASLAKFSPSDLFDELAADFPGIKRADAFMGITFAWAANRAEFIELLLHNKHLERANAALQLQLDHRVAA